MAAKGRPRVGLDLLVTTTVRFAPDELERLDELAAKARCEPLPDSAQAGRRGRARA